jgi:hypothetical protein
MNLPTSFSRRRFLALSATVGLGGIVVACGGSTPTSDGQWSEFSPETSGDLQIVKRYPSTGLVAGTVRLPISLSDKSGVLGTSGSVDLPQQLTARIINAETGDVVHDAVVAQQHSENLSVPYWPFVFDIATEGVYLLKLNIAPNTENAFQIEERKNVLTPLVGDPLPPFDTPTTDNNRGVDPICTSPDGACPFHSQTLTEALKSGKPVVYLIGTPAYCKTGTCAPALDALVDVAASLGDAVTFVHADVYKDKSATVAAPAVQAYKLSYEPVLYITDKNGKLINRLDAVFDVKELRDSLAAAGIS